VAKDNCWAKQCILLLGKPIGWSYLSWDLRSTPERIRATNQRAPWSLSDAFWESLVTTASCRASWNWQLNSKVDLSVVLAQVPIWKWTSLKLVTVQVLGSRTILVRWGALILKYPSLYNILQCKEVFVASVLATVSLNIGFRWTLTGNKWIGYIYAKD
jgi:hypothetical protein